MIHIVQSFQQIFNLDLKIAKQKSFFKLKVFPLSARPSWARGLTLKRNKFTGWAGLAYMLLKNGIFIIIALLYSLNAFFLVFLDFLTVCPSVRPCIRTSIPPHGPSSKA